MSKRAAWGWTLCHLVIAAGAAALASGLERDSSAKLFLRRDDPVRLAYERLSESFGPDTFVVVTCRGDGSEGFRSRVEELATELRACPSVISVEFPSAGSPITEELGLMSPERERLSLPVTLASAAPDSLRAVHAVLGRHRGLDPGIAGQPELNLALRDASDAVGLQLFPVLALAMIALLAVAHRSTRVTAAVLAVTAAALAAGMAYVAIFDEPVNLITIMLPVLLLALTVALCVHLVNSFRVHRGAGLPVREAVRRMRREEFRPCLVTSLTTAAGFGSFGLSRIEPLRVLGVTMALSILTAFAIAYTLLPALLTLLRPEPREGLRISAGLLRAVPPLVRRPRPVLAAFAVLVAAGLLLAPRISRETNALNYLAVSHPLRLETERLEAEGVGTASLDLILRVPPGKSLTSLRGPLHRLDNELVRWRGTRNGPVRGVLSPLSLAREGAHRLGLSDPAALESAALASAAFGSNDRLARFRNERTGEVRVSLRVDPVGVDEYRAIRAELDSMAGAALRDSEDASFELTGELALVMTVQQELLTTLLESLGGTAVTIFVLLALFFRSARLALLTLLPALAPLGFVLVACALAGISLSVATVMVLAVVLGIVTDDSVHMLDAFRSGHSLEAGLRRVGTAVAETSLAIFLGFAVLGWAMFVPTREFGLLTAGATLVALAADVVLFPVLLRRAPARTLPALLESSQ